MDQGIEVGDCKPSTHSFLLRPQTSNASSFWTLGRSCQGRAQQVALRGSIAVVPSDVTGIRCKATITRVHPNRSCFYTEPKTGGSAPPFYFCILESVQLSFSHFSSLRRRHHPSLLSSCVFYLRTARLPLLNSLLLYSELGMNFCRRKGVKQLEMRYFPP